MHFRRTRQGAGRERRFEHIHAGEWFAICTFAQDTFDIAHDMHHMAVAFHHKGFRHFDAANLCDATDIVTRQINQHDMFGTLFRIVDEFELCSLVCFWRGAAWTRTSQWADGDFLAFRRVFLTHQNFWRCAHYMGIAQVVVIHIRARVERTQGTVQRQWARRKFFVDALPHLHLHEVARSDQLFGALDSSQVVKLRKTALHGMAGARSDRWRDRGCF